MRTHGAKELRDTIIATPRENMSKIVQVRLLWTIYSILFNFLLLKHALCHLLLLVLIFCIIFAFLKDIRYVYLGRNW